MMEMPVRVSKLGAATPHGMSELHLYSNQAGIGLPTQLLFPEVEEITKRSRGLTQAGYMYVVYSRRLFTSTQPPDEGWEGKFSITSGIIVSRKCRLAYKSLE